MEGATERNDELTSTMGNLLSTTTAKNEACSDATPTSSTDAFTTTLTTPTTSDDIISSTSCEEMNKPTGNSAAGPSGDVAVVDANKIPLRSTSCGSFVVTEKDLLEMNITDTSTEKITENVDDIVQDLENLLGEPTTSFNFNSNRKVNEADDAEMDFTLPGNTEITSDPISIVAKLHDPGINTNADLEPLPTPEVPMDVPMETIPNVENNETQSMDFSTPDISGNDVISEPATSLNFTETDPIKHENDVVEHANELQTEPEKIIPILDIEENVSQPESVMPLITTTPNELEQAMPYVELPEPNLPNPEDTLEELIEEVAVTVDDNKQDLLANILVEEKPTPFDIIPIESADATLTEFENVKDKSCILKELPDPTVPSSEEEKAQEDNITEHIQKEPECSAEQTEETSVIEEPFLPLEIEANTELQSLEVQTLDEEGEEGELITESESKGTDSTTLSSSEPVVDIPQSMEVEEIQELSMELQDDNLETLLAVAQLAESTYQLPSEESQTTEEQLIEERDELLTGNQEPTFINSRDQVVLLEEAAGQKSVEVDKAEETLAEELPSQMDIQQTRLQETLIVQDAIISTNQQSEAPIIEEELSILENPSDTNIAASSSSEGSPKPDESVTVKTIESPMIVEETAKEEVPIVDKPTEAAPGNLKVPLLINVDENVEKDRSYSPKITIKPIKMPEDSSEESSKQPLKMTITKQSNTMHSILKIYNPEEDEGAAEPSVPKLIIKPVVPPSDQHSPKRKVFSPTNQRSSSPRITIKPIVKPPEEASVSPLKITIKPVLKEQKHSPKISIKPIVKPDEEEPKVHSPRVTIKPIIKPPDELEAVLSPRITIKPIKPPENVETSVKTACSSPKITIKPIVKPPEEQEDPDEFKERIVLKINKGTLPEKSEKLAKIKLKFSKEGGHPHIVQESGLKRPFEDDSQQERFAKKQKMDEGFKLRELLNTPSSSSVITIDDDDEVGQQSAFATDSPIVISEESNSDTQPSKDPLGDVPIYEVPVEVVTKIEGPVMPPAPRKRGRPRKIPLEVREEFKDPREEEQKPVVESTRPKRSCRGPSVRTTLGIKPRKPRGPGRGRGSKRGMGTRMISPPRTREPKLSATAAKLKAKEDFLALTEKLNASCKKEEPQESQCSSSFESTSNISQTNQSNESCDRADIVMYEEETRMSAESRAQTPAKQVQQVVLTSLPTADLVEESQSSVQSSATTESAKVRKGSRLEVQEPEGSIISADQLAEYYWAGCGPYMLQEQVAQFLGIKSFKRKYPNIPRRFVDMQERDFIRESGLAGESMCDLGLTAVNSNDILDIMYSDFQDKYEEYCKHQRDRQAKDMTNKQKALTLAAMQEKNRVDITQQAVQSAAGWNAKFNKTRKEQRKACMDLQTLTVHYPKGRMKQINKPKLGNYPVALVPGQFADYYREFTTDELNNLPINTICYERAVRSILPEIECDSQTDGSGSDSDTSTSDSESSFSGSSDGEDCTLCKHSNKKTAV